ncbi:MAG: oligosaccharide repeat unit polymerase [Prevotella sp.]|nr:oligosaccharide repeat unit polymerase [Prevotella sp.]
MINIDFLYSFILCSVFATANFLKLGLQNKTYVLPSTFFALMWGLTSLGGFLYSNIIVGDSDYYSEANHLKEISSYQLSILMTIFSAFLLARFVRRDVAVKVTAQFSRMDIVYIRRKTRWILYLFFAIGVYRLITVMSITGFNYSVIRTYYVESRSHFGAFELNIIRIGSYVSQFAVLYVCILGMEAALRGIRLKRFVIDFLLFIPFQMSFGGRLFILSFFVPFFFSYFLVRSVTAIRGKGKKIDKKFLLILALPLIMLVIVQILKMDEVISMQTIGAYSTEIFYSSSAYIHMNELWNSLPREYSLGYGMNCLGLGSSVYSNIIESWTVRYNSALVCVPSMIPQIFLDFGKEGSLVFYFIVFYLIEDRAMVCMKNLTIKNILVINLLCQVTYQTVSSSAFDCLRAFVVGYIALLLFVQMTKTKYVRNSNY